MKIFSTWKLLRTTRWIRIRSPFVRHTSLEQRTHNFPPPVRLSENAKHLEYFPGCFPPSSISPISALDHPWHRVLPCYSLWCFVCPVFTVSSPLFFSGRPWDRRWCHRVWLRHRRPLLARATRQAPSRSTRYRLFLLSTACIRVV